MGVQFDIIMNILVSSSRFIGIPMLWDYATAIINILILSVRVLTLDVRIWRLLTVGDGLQIAESGKVEDGKGVLIHCYQNIIAFALPKR